MTLRVHFTRCLRDSRDFETSLELTGYCDMRAGSLLTKTTTLLKEISPPLVVVLLDKSLRSLFLDEANLMTPSPKRIIFSAQSTV